MQPNSTDSSTALSADADTGGNACGGNAVSILLTSPPTVTDFQALDLIFANWPRGTSNSTDPSLLAVARNLASQFGLPGKMPMATANAWHMLDAIAFEGEFASQLTAIKTFIQDWQRTQKTFLILEFGELELIEVLFEALSPVRHIDLLASVMDFKVLSNRRLGLLRRIPMRLRKSTGALAVDEAMAQVTAARKLLERIANPLGFAPIVETSKAALAEVDKLTRKLATAAAPTSAGTATISRAPAAAP